MPRSIDYIVVLEPQPEGGFTVHVPAFPEVVKEGDTEAEALTMAAEAPRLAIGYRLDNGIGIASDMTPNIRTVTIAA